MVSFELSSKKYKNGRRPFTAVLYELQPPECVVNNVGTKFNKNGITFLEEYAEPALDSIEDMSVRVEFIDDERTQILAHGDTGVSEGMPRFDNATVIGHFKKGYIANVDVKGEMKRCVCGKGYIDEMAYQPFVRFLEEQLALGMVPNGSIEIYKTANNDGIVYKNGDHTEMGRIPTEYSHIGWDFVIAPSDESSILIELNNKQKQKEESNNMNKDEIKSIIEETVTYVTNSFKDYVSKIDELNSNLEECNRTIEENKATIEAKDTEINTLKAEAETAKNTIEDLQNAQKTDSAEKDKLEKQVDEYKKAEKISEMESAISNYSDEEKKYAETEINSFRENPLEGDINAITSKICVGIVTKQKADAKIVETNSKKDNDSIYDIFSPVYAELNSADDASDDEIDIYG